MNAKNLINWGELSRLLSGDRGNVRRNRIPAKYQADIDSLVLRIEEWKKEIEPNLKRFISGDS